MVHLDKVEGQRGAMVIQEDGSIVSSSGELSSAEPLAQTLVSLLSHALTVDFNSVGAASGQQHTNGYVNPAAVNDAGGLVAPSATGTSEPQQQTQSPSPAKWNRVTVTFGDHSYVACLSNKRVHVVKRSSTAAEEAAAAVVVEEGGGDTTEG